MRWCALMGTKCLNIYKTHTTRHFACGSHRNRVPVRFASNGAPLKSIYSIDFGRYAHLIAVSFFAARDRDESSRSTSVQQDVRGITPARDLRQPSNHNEANVHITVRVIGTGIG